ncbi:MAG: hypothetical protein ACLP6E_16200, partial [Acidimicrobiales bacterium]
MTSAIFVARDTRANDSERRPLFRVVILLCLILGQVGPSRVHWGETFRHPVELFVDTILAARKEMSVAVEDDRHR